MAVRVTNEDMRAMTLYRRGGASASTTEDFSVYIEMATIVTDRVAACAAADSSRTTPTDAEEALIERLLAAHFWALDDQEYKSRRTERAAGSFGGEWGKGFEFTSYGQQAMRVDPSGCLNELNTPKKKLKSAWLGKPPSSQIDYVDRD